MGEAQTPVLVGVGQVLQRLDGSESGNSGKEPLDLMLDAVRAAAHDAEAPALLTEATSLRVIRGRWGYRNPARVLAERLGNTNVETGLTTYGGNFVQTTVNRSCLAIQAGDHDIIIITGAECGKTQAAAAKAGTRPQWSEAPGVPDLYLGPDEPMSTPAEEALGLVQPIQWYPLFESAIRFQRGEALPEHLRRISELWAGFSRVAAGNPHAWLREPLSAEEIGTVSARNRPVSYPYAKYLNSNNSVDMGAALILCSVAVAKRLAIPQEKWVYPHAGTDAHDTYATSERDNLHSSPAIRLAGRRALELARCQPEDLDHVDIYSCFPSAVQVGASELGLPLTRPLTVTGGLTFNGGPLNNYVSHAIARMAEVLRAEPGTTGLVTANGGFLTKHAFGVYSTTPPEHAYRHEDLQAEVDKTPVRQLDEAYTGPFTVEACTVMYDANGPHTAYLTGLTPAGTRVLATNKEPDTMVAMTEEEFCGRTATRSAEGRAAF